MMQRRHFQALPALSRASSLGGLLTVLALLLSVFAVPGSLRAEDDLRDLKKDFLKAVRGDDEESHKKALAIARRIGALGTEDAADLLFDVGIKTQTPRLFKGIGEILASMVKHDAVLELLVKKSKSSRFTDVIFVADIAGFTGNEHGVKLLANMTDTRDERVLRTVIPALRKLRIRASVPPLLELLERFGKSRSSALVLHEVRAALWDLTGQDFEALEDWTKWWDTVKDSFDPDAEREGQTYVSRSKDQAPEFAGKKILSKNALFVIDSSGTMRYVMKDDIPGLGVGDGTDGGAVKGGGQMTPEDSRLARFWTRIEMAKRALVGALEKFSSGTRFNVMEFNRIVKSLNKKLIPASPRSKKKAIEWVKRMKFSTVIGTNTEEALVKALSTPGVAEIFFLSDGLPSKDGKKNDDPMPILDKIEGMNRFRRVKVHTFGYDPVPFSQRGQVTEDHPQVQASELHRANQFLKLLSERTGGTFTMLKVDPNLKPPKDFK